MFISCGKPGRLNNEVREDDAIQAIDLSNVFFLCGGDGCDRAIQLTSEQSRVLRVDIAISQAFFKKKKKIYCGFKLQNMH